MSGVERLFLRTYVPGMPEQMFSPKQNKRSEHMFFFAEHTFVSRRIQANICSHNAKTNIRSCMPKPNVCSLAPIPEHMFGRTYVLLRKPCRKHEHMFCASCTGSSPAQAPFCQNRQETGKNFGCTMPDSCEFSIDFSCMKWYNVSG